MRPRLAALLPLAVLAACGGPRLSAPGVIEGANTVCREAVDRIEALPSPGAGDAERRRYLADVIEQNEVTAANLETLTFRAPEEMRAPLRALVAALRSSIAGLSETLAADELGDRRAMRRGQRRTADSRDLFDRLAAQMRLIDCVARGG